MMELNSTFFSNIKDIYGSTGEQWLQTLPARLSRLAQKWNFQFLSPMPELSYNFVGLVQLNDPNRKAVIKIGCENTLLANEVRWLQCFRHSVPQLYGWDELECAYLMEYIDPGYSLKKWVQEDKDNQAIKVICDVIQALQTQQTPIETFKPISELEETLTILKGHLSPKLLSKAQSLWQDLSMSKQQVILHGDLHHGNILASNNTWKVIDPHAYQGDPAFEVGSILFNPYDCLPRDPVKKWVERRLNLLIEYLPFDPQRIKAWAFCKTLLSVAWTFEDHQKIDAGEVEIAEAIDKTKI